MTSALLLAAEPLNPSIPPSMKTTFISDSRELIDSLPTLTGDAARLALRLSQALDVLDIVPSNVIPVYVRSVYGNEHIYVADSDKARALASLTSSKTLTHSHVRALQELGFTFEHVADPRAKSTLAESLFALGASAVNVPSNPQA